MPFRPVKPGKVAVQAFAHLREVINGGQLGPGERRRGKGAFFCGLSADPSGNPLRALMEGRELSLRKIPEVRQTLEFHPGGLAVRRAHPHRERDGRPGSFPNLVARLSARDREPTAVIDGLVSFLPAVACPPSLVFSKWEIC